MLLRTARNTFPIAALLLCAGAHAWDSTSIVSANLPSDFQPPTNIALPDQDGFWVAGTPGNQPVIVRYDNSGTPQFTHYIQYHYSLYDLKLATMPDGGLAVADKDGASQICAIRRYAKTGNLVWTNPSVPQSISLYGDACDPIRVDGAEGIWVASAGPLYRLGADGAAVFVADLTTLNSNGSIGDPQGPNLFVFGGTGMLGSGPPQSLATVAKISATGQTLWQWQAPAADNGSALLRMGVGADGNLYGFGLIGTFPNYSLYGAAVSAAGTTLWTRTYTDISVTNVDIVATANAGASYVSFQPATGNVTLARVSANGDLAWTKSVAAKSATDQCSNAALHAAANGDALVVGVCAGTMELDRYAANGDSVFSKTLAAGGIADSQLLADGSILLLTMQGAGPYFYPRQFQRFGADGNTLPPPQTQSIIAAIDNLDSAAFSDDGSAYIRSTNSASQRYSLTGIAPDGQPLWQQQEDDTWNIAQTLAVGGSVCLAGELGANAAMSCFSADTGTPGATAQLGVIQTNTGTYAHAAGDDRIILLYQAGDSLFHHALVATNGTVLHDQTPLENGEYWGSTGSNNAGDSLIATSDTNYAKVAADGTRRYGNSIPTSAGVLRQTFLADDGTGLLFTLDSSDTPTLTRVDAGGAVLWSKSLSPAATGAYDWISSLRITGDGAYLALGHRGAFGDPFSQQFPYKVLKVSLADGSVSWATTVTGILFNFPQLILDPIGAHVLVTSGWPTKIHVQVLDANDGSVVKDHFEGCGTDDCRLFFSNVASDGALRMIAETSSDANGNKRRIFALNQPFATEPANIRIDQAGIDGAWYAPYESGQGFTLDYIAGAHITFMPWFTYTQAGDNDPAGLAWYTLQGSVTPGATSADLTIGATDPGTFNSGIVGSHVVGTARLSFSDCSSGSLYYQFNADTNNGAGGFVSLARLSPSTDACVLADGSSTPAQIANAPAQGFDARQSGSWYDPSTSGQGLEITIIPAGNGFGGLVFAAWFTFDPANQSDDPAHQHRFTLQGDFSTAANGTVTLPILRTIGGTFDATPTANTVQVGHATLSMQGCDAARLDYQFDQSEVTHAFAGLSGTTNLVKIGGCTAP